MNNKWHSTNNYTHEYEDLVTTTSATPQTVRSFSIPEGTSATLETEFKCHASDLSAAAKGKYTANGRRATGGSLTAVGTTLSTDTSGNFLLIQPSIDFDFGSNTFTMQAVGKSGITIKWMIKTKFKIST